MHGTVITIKRDGSDGGKYPLLTDCFIGSNQNCEIQIKNPGVSGKHCVISAIHPGCVTVQNLTSTNKTVVNGREIGSHSYQLKHKDIITIGDRSFRWESLESRDRPMTGMAQVPVSALRRHSEPYNLSPFKLVAVVSPQPHVSTAKDVTNPKRRKTMSNLEGEYKELTGNKKDSVGFGSARKATSTSKNRKSKTRKSTRKSTNSSSSVRKENDKTINFASSQEDAINYRNDSEGSENRELMLNTMIASQYAVNMSNVSSVGIDKGKAVKSKIPKPITGSSKKSTRRSTDQQKLFLFKSKALLKKSVLDSAIKRMEQGKRRSNKSTQPVHVKPATFKITNASAKKDNSLTLPKTPPVGKSTKASTIEKHSTPGRKIRSTSDKKLTSVSGKKLLADKNSVLNHSKIKRVLIKPELASGNASSAKNISTPKNKSPRLSCKKTRKSVVVKKLTPQFNKAKTPRRSIDKVISGKKIETTKSSNASKKLPTTSCDFSVCSLQSVTPPAGFSSLISETSVLGHLSSPGSSEELNSRRSSKRDILALKPKKSISENKIEAKKKKRNLLRLSKLVSLSPLSDLDGSLSGSAIHGVKNVLLKIQSIREVKTNKFTRRSPRSSEGSAANSSSPKNSVGSSLEKLATPSSANTSTRKSQKSSPEKSATPLSASTSPKKSLRNSSEKPVNPLSASMNKSQKSSPEKSATPLSASTSPKKSVRNSSEKSVNPLSASTSSRMSLRNNLERVQSDLSIHTPVNLRKILLKMQSLRKTHESSSDVNLETQNTGKNKSRSQSPKQVQSPARNAQVLRTPKRDEKSDVKQTVETPKSKNNNSKCKSQSSEEIFSLDSVSKTISSSKKDRRSSDINVETPRTRCNKSISSNMLSPDGLQLSKSKIQEATPVVEKKLPIKSQSSKKISLDRSLQASNSIKKNNSTKKVTVTGNYSGLNLGGFSQNVEYSNRHASPGQGISRSAKKTPVLLSKKISLQRNVHSIINIAPKRKQTKSLPSHSRKSLPTIAGASRSILIKHSPLHDKKKNKSVLFSLDSSNSSNILPKSTVTTISHKQAKWGSGNSDVLEITPALKEATPLKQDQPDNIGGGDLSGVRRVSMRKARTVQVHSPEIALPGKKRQSTEHKAEKAAKKLKAETPKSLDKKKMAALRACHVKGKSTGKKKPLYSDILKKPSLAVRKPLETTFAPLRKAAPKLIVQKTKKQHQAFKSVKPTTISRHVDSPDPIIINKRTSSSTKRSSSKKRKSIKKDDVNDFQASIESGQQEILVETTKSVGGHKEIKKSGASSDKISIEDNTLISEPVIGRRSSIAKKNLKVKFDTSVSGIAEIKNEVEKTTPRNLRSISTRQSTPFALVKANIENSIKPSRIFLDALELSSEDRSKTESSNSRRVSRRIQRLTDSGQKSTDAVCESFGVKSPLSVSPIIKTPRNKDLNVTARLLASSSRKRKASETFLPSIIASKKTKLGRGQRSDKKSKEESVTKNRSVHWSTPVDVAFSLNAVISSTPVTSEKQTKKRLYSTPTGKLFNEESSVSSETFLTTLDASKTSRSTRQSPIESLSELKAVSSRKILKSSRLSTMEKKNVSFKLQEDILLNSKRKRVLTASKTFTKSATSILSDVTSLSSAETPNITIDAFVSPLSRASRQNSVWSFDQDVSGIDYLSSGSANVSLEVELAKVPAKFPKSSCEDVEDVKKLLKTPRSPKSSYEDVEGVKKLLKTPRRSPTSSYEDVEGVKKLLKTPRRSPKSSYEDVEGVKKLFKTPSPKSSYENVEGVEQLLKTPKSPKSSYEDVGVKKLLKTPRRSPKSSYEDVEGVKKLLKTPRRSPKSSYEDVEGVKKLLKTPRSPKSSYENVEGIEQLLKTPKSPKSSYEDVEGLKKLLKTPRRSPKSSYEDVEGVKKLLKTPRRSPKSSYEDVDGVKQLFKTRSPKSSCQNVGVKRVFQTSPIPDYTDVIGIKRMFGEASNKSSYIDVTGVRNVFRQIQSPKSPVSDIGILFTSPESKATPNSGEKTCRTSKKIIETLEPSGCLSRSDLSVAQSLVKDQKRKTRNASRSKSDQSSSFELAMPSTLDNTDRLLECATKVQNTRALRKRKNIVETVDSPVKNIKSKEKKKLEKEKPIADNISVRSSRRQVKVASNESNQIEEKQINSVNTKSQRMLKRNIETEVLVEEPSTSTKKLKKKVVKHVELQNLDTSPKPAKRTRQKTQAEKLYENVEASPPKTLRATKTKKAEIGSNQIEEKQINFVNTKSRRILRRNIEIDTEALVEEPSTSAGNKKKLDKKLVKPVELENVDTPKPTRRRTRQKTQAEKLSKDVETPKTLKVMKTKTVEIKTVDSPKQGRQTRQKTQTNVKVSTVVNNKKSKSKESKISQPVQEEKKTKGDSEVKETKPSTRSRKVAKPESADPPKLSKQTEKKNKKSNETITSDGGKKTKQINSRPSLVLNISGGRRSASFAGLRKKVHFRKSKDVIHIISPRNTCTSERLARRKSISNETKTKKPTRQSRRKK